MPIIFQSSFEDYNVAAILDYLLRGGGGGGGLNSNNYHNISSSSLIGISYQRKSIANCKIGAYQQWTVLAYTPSSGLGSTNIYNNNSVLSTKICNQLLFKFTAYKMILCVDINTTSFTMSPDLTIPFRKLVDGAKNMIQQIALLLHQLHSLIEIKLIAHSCEMDKSIVLWEGCIDDHTDLSKLCASINVDVNIAERRIHSILKLLHKNKNGNRNFSQVLTHLDFHFQLMMSNAIPLAFLFTLPDSYVLQSLETDISFLGRNKIRLNFILLKMSSNYQETSSCIQIGEENYKLLAYSSGGRMYSLENLILTTEAFVFPLVHGVNFPSNSSSSSAFLVNNNLAADKGRNVTKEDITKLVDNQDVSYPTAMDMISLRINQGFQLVHVDDHTDINDYDSSLDVSISLHRIKRQARDVTKLIFEKYVSKMTRIVYEIQIDKSAYKSIGIHGMKSSYSVIIYQPWKTLTLNIPNIGLLKSKTPNELFQPVHHADKFITRWWKCYHQITAMLHASKDITKVISTLLNFHTAYGTSWELIYSCSAGFKRYFYLQFPIKNTEDNICIDFNRDSYILMTIINSLLAHYRHMQHISLSKNQHILLFHHESSSSYHFIFLQLECISERYLLLNCYDLGKIATAYSHILFESILTCIVRCLVDFELHPIQLLCDLTPLSSNSTFHPSLAQCVTESISVSGKLKMYGELFSIAFFKICQDKINTNFQLISSEEDESRKEQKLLFNYVNYSIAKRRHSLIICIITTYSHPAYKEVTIEYIYEKESILSTSIPTNPQQPSTLVSPLYPDNSMKSATETVNTLIAKDRYMLRLYELVTPLLSQSTITSYDLTSVRHIASACKPDYITVPLIYSSGEDSVLNSELFIILQKALKSTMNIKILPISGMVDDITYGYFVYENNFILVAIPSHGNDLSQNNMDDEDIVYTMEIKLYVLTLPICLNEVGNHCECEFSGFFQIWMHELKSHIFKIFLFNYSLLTYSTLLRNVNISKTTLDVALSTYRPYIAEADISLLSKCEHHVSVDDCFENSIGRYLLNAPIGNFFLINADMIFEKLELAFDENSHIKANISTSIYITFEVYLDKKNRVQDCGDRGDGGKSNGTSWVLPCDHSTFKQRFFDLLHLCRETQRQQQEEVIGCEYSVMKLRMICMHNTTIRDYLDDVSHARETQRQQRMKCLQTLQGQLNQFVAMQTLLCLCQDVEGTVLPKGSINIALECMSCLQDVSSDKMVFDVISPNLSNKRADISEEKLLDAYVSELRMRIQLHEFGDSSYYRCNFTMDNTPIACWIVVSAQAVTSQPKLSIPMQSVELSISVKVLQHEFQGLQSAILTSIRHILEKTCQYVNQKHLLRDLHNSKNACPLLIQGKDQPDRVNNPRSLSRSDSITDSAYFTSYKSFRPGCFECPRQGEISCVLHASAVMNQETAMKRLEVVALSPFAVTNLERVFVTQDSKSNVVYFKFDSENKNSNVITLGIFGITPLDSEMVRELELLLQSKLIELAAKAMSTVLSRNNTISTQYLHFLKKSGYAPRVKKFTLPVFVSDTYLFITLVKQVLIASQAVTQITLQMPQPKKFVFSEYLHPSALGYDLQGAEPESLANSSHDSSFETLAARSLRRAAHVDIEEMDATDIECTHPVFFNRNRRSLLQCKEEKDTEVKRLIWAQNDFTFLYNVLGPLPSGASVSSRLVAKQVGQGLALVEIALAGTLPIRTGSKRSPFEDVRQMCSYMKTSCPLRMYESPADDIDSSAHTRGSVPRGVEGPRDIWLRVFPAIPMADEKLSAFCESTFEHALQLYCVERLSASKGLSNEAPEEPLSPMARLRRQFSFRSTPSNAEYLRLMHDVQQQSPTSTVSSTGSQHFQMLLQPKFALELHTKVVASIHEAFPGLRRPYPGLKYTEPIFSSSGSTENTLRWKSSVQLQTSTIFGDVMRRPEEDASVLPHTSEVRLIVDSDQHSALPEWLRKRRFALEVIVYPAGMFLFYYNISPQIVKAICDICSNTLAPLKAKYTAAERANLRMLGIVLEAEERTDTAQEDTEETMHFRRQLDRLSWRSKTTTRLYLKLTAAPIESTVSPLASIPLSVWELGIPLTSRSVYMPSLGCFTQFTQKMLILSQNHDTDILINDDGNRVVLIVPIPNADVISVSILQVYSDDDDRYFVLITERLIDIADILNILAVTPPLKRLSDQYFAANKGTVSLAKFRYNHLPGKSLEILITNHPLLKSVRKEILIELTLSLVRYLLTAKPPSLQIATAAAETEAEAGDDRGGINIALVIDTLEYLSGFIDEIVLIKREAAPSLPLHTTDVLRFPGFIDQCGLLALPTKDDQLVVYGAFRAQLLSATLSGITLMVCSESGTEFVHIYITKHLDVRVHRVFKLQPPSDVDSITNELRNCWVDIIQNTWMKHNLDTVWKQIYDENTSCSPDYISQLKMFTICSELNCFDAFSTWLICSVLSANKVQEPLLAQLKSCGRCSAYIDGDIAYILIAKKIFHKEDMYELAVLIEIDSTRVAYSLLEKVSIPTTMDEHIERFLASIAIAVLNAQSIEKQQLLL